MINNRNASLLFLILLAMAINIAIAYFAIDPIHFQKYPYFAQRADQAIEIGEWMIDIEPFISLRHCPFFEIFGPNLTELTLEPEAFVLFFNALACNIIKKSYTILADL
jgi:hypothetical protein